MKNETLWKLFIACLLLSYVTLFANGIITEILESNALLLFYIGQITGITATIIGFIGLRRLSKACPKKYEKLFQWFIGILIFRSFLYIGTPEGTGVFVLSVVLTIMMTYGLWKLRKY